ncbi:phosphoenolpyruvate phosphomutase [Capronia epimyces CBS 606.96]|uniref:Phosphoenolpyruvate phosphomutase n=1 Tax=Capronia epimyces CBS 606.96 TaxID=1182542 RepID=W9XCE0_9EURO|nr:phosphoenolpyruvate phosphomutase [Capronia epimyces CBS 606.96]EXJ77858.1 phosphoenolpyruvate phosphomutase [Capronia epimyces CBS 606.96]
MPAAWAKAEALRASLNNTVRPLIAMAAHNPLGAKLAAEAGFGAVWASGFELSASYGLPDASILSMQTHLDMTRAISEAQPLPVVADLDTGFGNAANVAYAIPQYVAAGAAAVVIEDKVFPKTTSLRKGANSTNGDAHVAPAKRQTLVSIAEFQGKIAAAKAAAKATAGSDPSSNLVVIARTEALIAGLGQDEALRRARAYVEAGADAILVHSKQTRPDEIETFCRAWPAGSVPLVIIPTAYPQLSFARAAALDKVGLIICGNHAVRSAVASLRQTFARILADGSLEGVEAQIAPLADVFALQGEDKLRDLEQKYLV